VSGVPPISEPLMLELAKKTLASAPPIVAQ
jgi:hypothetical protein